MAKVVLDNLANLQNETSVVNTINTNNNRVEAAMEITLSRDGNAPNEMNTQLDMNGYPIINLRAPILPTEPLRLEDLGTLETVVGDILSLEATVQTAVDAAIAADASADAAALDAADTAVLVAEVEAALATLDNVGAIQCDATYDIDTGLGRYHLTAKNLNPITIEDGVTLEFNPPTTAVVGAIRIFVDTVDQGFLYVASGSRRATFQEVRRDQPIRIRYHEATTYRPAGFIVQTPSASWRDTNIGTHGKFALAADFTNGIIHMQGWDGGYATCLVKNPATGELCMTDGPVQANIFNGTAYVNSVANSSCSGNTFYYIYLFMPDGSDPYTRAFDFDQTPPTSNYLGMLVKGTDDSRTMVGFLYTFDTDTSFRTTGIKPTLAVQNLYNGMRLHMTSSIQSTTGIGGSWVDFPDAACRTTVNAETNLPHFTGHCNLTGTSGTPVAEFRLKLTGIDANTGTPFTQYTEATRSSVAVGGWTTLSSSFGAALSTGTLIATPQTRFISGSGNGGCWVFGDCYQ